MCAEGLWECLLKTEKVRDALSYPQTPYASTVEAIRKAEWDDNQHHKKVVDWIYVRMYMFAWDHIYDGDDDDSYSDILLTLLWFYCCCCCLSSSVQSLWFFFVASNSSRQHIPGVELIPGHLYAASVAKMDLHRKCLSKCTRDSVVKRMITVADALLA